jgi:ADP-ribose pyrophosphatase YjhB (NUDIX family)
MVDDSQAKTAAHAVLAAVLQVRDGRLQALLWQRAREPFASSWALPGGALAGDETLEESMRRHLAEKVDVREVSHLEQLETRSDPRRNPARRELATAFLGLVPSGVDPQVPEDTRWHPLDELPASVCGGSSPTRTSASRSRRRRSPLRSCGTSTRPRSGIP